MAMENGRVVRGVPQATAPTAQVDQRTCPRRIVLLKGDQESEVESVLGTYTGSEPRGKDVHDEIVRLAGRYRGRCVAAEWLGPLGWSRFLWCRLE